jgi:hypothetical protein
MAVTRVTKLECDLCGASFVTEKPEESNWVTFDVGPADSWRSCAVCPACVRAILQRVEKDDD